RERTHLRVDLHLGVGDVRDRIDGNTERGPPSDSDQGNGNDDDQRATPEGKIDQPGQHQCPSAQPTPPFTACNSASQRSRAPRTTIRSPSYNPSSIAK